MDTKEFISVEMFCLHHNVEVSFVVSLQDFNLVEIVQENDVSYFHVSQLGGLERIVRLHNDLSINREGIDAVLHLLQKIDAMQQEIDLLKGRLRIYNDGLPD